MMPTVDLARKLISQQFPESVHLPIIEVERQGHDNRTYRLGNDLLIRMPTAASYALKVPKEQQLLPQLAKYLSVSIPAPIAMGKPSVDYPYPFSMYKWLPGKSLNLLVLTEQEQLQLAGDLAEFLLELQSITRVVGPQPGQHNWWRGDHVIVYDRGAREQIAQLTNIIDATAALDLWEQACATRWHHDPVWIHGDLAIGNILIVDGKLSALIDFGGAAVGDPACDLTIAWSYFSDKAREVFMQKMNLEGDAWLRAGAWALWKATFELCQISDKNTAEAALQRQIIDCVIGQFV
jgi:aminoglycoside phosphotransferase (APT) family kinase protein